MLRSRLVLLALSICCAVAARAQEFDIFDTNDFLDPRMRGVALIPDEHGIKMSDEAPFLVSKISVGRVSDYYSRTMPTGADLNVAHLATSYYRGRHQFNLKLTDYQNYGNGPSESTPMPRRRATFQWGVYEADVLNSPARPDADPPKDVTHSVVLNRYMFSLSVEDAFMNAKSRNYELGSEVDVRIPGTEVLGTLSYVMRHTPDGVAQRFAYVYRFGQEGFKRVNVDWSLGYVAQKANHWQWGNLRPAVHARIALDRLSSAIHVAYAPTISVIGGIRMRHETAIFVDYTTIAHVFRRVPQAEVPAPR